MKKLRSKRGFTLVELIVAVAILSMVAGMGAGIVGQAIRNYSTAQITSYEQETAMSVESFILGGARVASNATKTDSININDKEHTAFYLHFDEDGTLQTIRNDAVAKDKDPVVSYVSYKGVRKIALQMKKQKPSEDENYKGFLFLEYTIEMQEGYILRGSAVVNNADTALSMSDTPNPLIDAADKIEITSDNSDYTLCMAK